VFLFLFVNGASGSCWQMRLRLPLLASGAPAYRDVPLSVTFLAKIYVARMSLVTDFTNDSISAAVAGMLATGAFGTVPD